MSSTTIKNPPPSENSPASDSTPTHCRSAPGTKKKHKDSIRCQGLLYFFVQISELSWLTASSIRHVDSYHISYHTDPKKYGFTEKIEKGRNCNVWLASVVGTTVGNTRKSLRMGPCFQPAFSFHPSSPEWLLLCQQWSWEACQRTWWTEIYRLPGSIITILEIQKISANIKVSIISLWLEMVNSILSSCSRMGLKRHPNYKRSSLLVKV